jgi:hypothetical protein
MPDKDTYLETERRLTRLEADMQHLKASVAEVRADAAEIKQRVDGIDKRVIVLCAVASGGGTALVQLLPMILQMFHVAAK